MEGSIHSQLSEERRDSTCGTLPGESEDELSDVASGGQPGPSSGMGWNTAPVLPSQPQAPFQPPYQPPAQNFHPDPPAPNINNTGLPFHLPDPPEDPEPKHPGGFVPFNPQTSVIPSYEQTKPGGAISPEQIAKAQKLCKYVQSALTYEDVPTAIENLHKCLRLLQTGQE